MLAGRRGGLVHDERSKGSLGSRGRFSDRLFASRGDSVMRSKAGTLLIRAVSLMDDHPAGILLNDSRGREFSDEF